MDGYVCSFGIFNSNARGTCVVRALGGSRTLLQNPDFPRNQPGRPPRRAVPRSFGKTARAGGVVRWWWRNDPSADTTTRAMLHHACAVVRPVQSGCTVLPFVRSTSPPKGPRRRWSPPVRSVISATLRFHRNLLSFYHECAVGLPVSSLLTPRSSAVAPAEL